MMLPRLLSAARHPGTVRRMRAGYAALNRLPYRRIVCLDTEFRTMGDPHRGWCLCGVELRSGEEYRLWLDGYTGGPPFPLDNSVLLIAFVAGAEVATMRARGWPMPARIFDLFQELRVVTNNGQPSTRFGLETGCAHYGIATYEHAAKKAWQLEAQARTDWPADKQRGLVDYCFNDALDNARLFLCMWPDWLEVHAGHEERGLFFALQRGLFAGAMAEAELRGTPFNENEWPDLVASRETVFAAMVADLMPELRSIYRPSRDGPVFTTTEFERVMSSRGLAEFWPRTPTGQLVRTRDMLREMLHLSPDLSALQEVMQIRSRTALLQCEVGSDGRARTPFFPGSTATGRCLPKPEKFIFGAPRQFRNVIQAMPGRVVIGFDYVAQETALLGAYAEDHSLLGAYDRGDVHLECARLCGLVSSDTVAKEARRKIKACNLGVPYGARPRRIAAQLGISEGEAWHFFDIHRRVFHRSHEFCAEAIMTSEVERVTVLQDGWRKIVPAPFSPTSAVNFPIQGGAASILRQAVLGFYAVRLPLLATVLRDAMRDQDMTQRALGIRP
jgi:DNA polymerase-1